MSDPVQQVNFNPLITMQNNTNQLLGSIAQSLAAIVSTGAVIPGWVSAPASDSATGVAGQIAYDATHFYVCVATDTWKRCTIAGGF